MLTIFMIIIGAAAVLIQFVSLRTALQSWNYWHIRKSIFDLGADTIVFMIAVSGGVIAFYIAVTASFVITVYLNWFSKEDFNRPEPIWFVYLKVIGRKMFKNNI